MEPTLERARYVSLETFRKDGSGVKTPVWAAVVDGELVVATDGTTYKVKRVRNDPRVRVAVCNASGKTILGPFHDGKARILEGAEAERADAALTAKYGWQRRGFQFFARLFGKLKQPVVFAITVDAAPASAPAPA